MNHTLTNIAPPAKAAFGSARLVNITSGDAVAAGGSAADLVEKKAKGQRDFSGAMRMELARMAPKEKGEKCEH